MRHIFLLLLTPFLLAATPPSTAIITLYRPAADALFIRTPDVILNDSTVCSLGENDMATLTVPAGPVTIETSSWDAASYIKLDAKPGATYHLRISGEQLAFDAAAPEAADLRGSEHDDDWFYMELVRESTAARERQEMEPVECAVING